jgi:hypothetical protein
VPRHTRFGVLEQNSGAESQAVSGRLADYRNLGRGEANLSRTSLASGPASRRMGRCKGQACAICGALFQEFGHSAEPVKRGRCCNLCNDAVVIPERIRLMGCEMKPCTKYNETGSRPDAVRRTVRAAP